jgi:hypothetical protein
MLPAGVGVNARVRRLRLKCARNGCGLRIAACARKSPNAQEVLPPVLMRNGMTRDGTNFARFEGRRRMRPPAPARPQAADE